MKRFVSLAVGCTLVALAPFAVPLAAADVQIAVGPTSAFSPAQVTINAGDRVTWTNMGGFHNVRADDNSFRCANGCDGAGGNGDPSSSGWTASVDFFDPERVPYYCEIHGGTGGSGMSGAVTVRRSIFADGFEGEDTGEWGPDLLGGACLGGGTPIPLTVPTVALAGDLHGALNRLDLTGSAGCFSEPARGRDRVYSFAVDGGSEYAIDVTPLEPGFDPVVYLLSSSGCAAQPLTCRDASNSGGPGVAEPIVWVASGSETLYLVVDSLSPATAGSHYQIDIALIP